MAGLYTGGESPRMLSPRSKSQLSDSFWLFCLFFSYHEKLFFNVKTGMYLFHPLSSYLRLNSILFVETSVFGFRDPLVQVCPGVQSYSLRRGERAVSKVDYHSWTLINHVYSTLVLNTEIGRRMPGFNVILSCHFLAMLSVRYSRKESLKTQLPGTNVNQALSDETPQWRVSMLCITELTSLREC